MSDVSRGFKGHCLCGQVHYSCDSAPMSFVRCHCRDCQRVSGGGPAPFVVVPSDSMQISGSLKKYASQADSGRRVERQFCSDCGTQLFSEAEMMPGLLMVKVGAMEDPSGLALNAEAWVDSAQPWQPINKDVPNLPTQVEPG